MNDVCQLLKETRVSKGLSLDEVAQRTYIKLHYLEALEEGELSKLPAMVHTYGYIRQYAKLLGLDGGALVAQFQQQERGPAPQPKPLERVPTNELFTDSMSFLKPMKASYSGHVPTLGQGYANGSAVAQAPEADTDSSPSLPMSAMRVPSEPADVLAARAQAQEILLAAEREARQLVRGAESYADEVLGQLEAEVAQSLQVIVNGRQFLEARRRTASPALGQ